MGFIWPSRSLVHQNKISVYLQTTPLKAGSPFLIHIPSTRFQKFYIKDLELSALPQAAVQQKYFGVISLYERNAVLFSGFSKIAKTLFSHPVEDFFMEERKIENKLLHSPISLRIPASFFKSIESLQETEIKEQKKLIKSTIQESKDFAADFCFETQRPLKSKIVSEFGSYRRLPSGAEYFHTGLDLRAMTGTSVFASAYGKVKLSRFFHLSGNSVIMDHGNSIFSKYYHLSELHVAEESFVRKGLRLGKSGGTGRVEAPHLHWEIAWKGIPTDPLEFIKLQREECQQTLSSSF